MIRLSTTLLEQYRRVLQTDYAKVEELIASIKGEPFTPTWQMEAGADWDRLLSSEEPSIVRYGKPKDLTSAGYYFSPEAVLEARRKLGAGIPQVKAVRRWNLDGQEVDVVAQVDWIHGRIIMENKACFSKVSLSNYEPALQWRFYLAVHQGGYVQYNLFDFAPPKEGYCELMGVVSGRFWWYADLETDCRRWLKDFLKFCEERELTSFLHRESHETKNT